MFRFISIVVLLALSSVALGADAVPVDQRLALQIAGLTLQNAKLGYDLEMCQTKEAKP